MITPSEVRQCFRTVTQNADNKALNYAIGYAKHGLFCADNELYVQTLYVLNNITAWRGDEAKKTRETLKAFVKQQKKVG